MAKRDYDLEVRALVAQLGLPDPVPEHRVLATRRFRFDYAWPDRKIALEIEGGFFGTGRRCPACRQLPRSGHSSVRRLKDDADKYSFAAAIGWTIIRRWPDALLTHETRAMLRAAFGFQEGDVTEFVESAAQDSVRRRR